MEESPSECPNPLMCLTITGIGTVFGPANSKNHYFRLCLIVKITTNAIFALDDG